MLTGDSGKYIAVVCGVAFASLLITQQSVVLCGVMLRTTNRGREIHGVHIWISERLKTTNAGRAFLRLLSRRAVAAESPASG